MTKHDEKYQEWKEQQKEEAYRNEQTRYTKAEEEWRAGREAHRKKMAQYSPEELEKAGREAIAEAKRLIAEQMKSDL